MPLIYSRALHMYTVLIMWFISSTARSIKSIASEKLWLIYFMFALSLEIIWSSEIKIASAWYSRIGVCTYMLRLLRSWCWNDIYVPFYQYWKLYIVFTSFVKVKKNFVYKSNMSLPLLLTCIGFEKKMDAEIFINIGSNIILTYFLRAKRLTI